MKQKIKNIATIQIGYPFRKKIEPLSEGTHRVIQMKDFDENRVLHVEQLTNIKLEGDVGKYLVSKDDILFLSRGHKNFAVMLYDSFEDTVVVSYFFILKVKTENILPEYLAWYINQPIAQKYIYNLARRGTHMPVVPLSEFENLKVDIPDLETQKKIVELNKLLDRENTLLKELQNKRTMLIRSLSIKAAKKAIK
jgi:restriction endonuclease S subunit